MRGSNNALARTALAAAPALRARVKLGELCARPPRQARLISCTGDCSKTPIGPYKRELLVVMNTIGGAYAALLSTWISCVALTGGSTPFAVAAVGCTAL